MGEKETTREEEELGGKHSKFRHGWQGRVGKAESATYFWLTRLVVVFSSPKMVAEATFLCSG